MKGNPIWGGRFAEPPDAKLRRLNDSFAFDRALLPEDVRGSIAWAGALREAGVLSVREHGRIVAGLRAVAAGGGTPGRGAGAAEDVHSFVEIELGRKVGALAGKLHTGRSRNDQVAVDFRLYLKDAFAEARGAVLALSDVLATRAAREASTAMPGYTHLKRAIPVTFGHWCLAYVEMLLRDAERLQQARVRADECPLGCGALAGTPVHVDRAALAARLGFARPSANSIDAVSDRDAAVEYLSAGALLLAHLSRMAEDLIVYSSDEFGFVALPDRLATGSSRMPQKKNPDLLELVRGHAGRAIGELAGLLAVVKGLPLAYDKDLQLDKEPVFRLRETLSAALPALAALVKDLRCDRARMRAAASDDRLLATELADALAARGIPFRRAHEIVGRRMARAEASGRRLADLPPGDGITPADLRALDVDRALARRGNIGGTAPARVRRAASAAQRRIERMRRVA